MPVTNTTNTNTGGSTPTANQLSTLIQSVQNSPAFSATQRTSALGAIQNAYGSGQSAPPAGSSWNPSTNSWNTPPVTVSVNAKELGTGTQAMTTGSAPTSVYNPNNIYASNIGGGADVTTGMYNTQVTPTTGQQTTTSSSQAAFDKYISSLQAPTDMATQYNKAQQEAGLIQAQQNRTNIQNSLNAETTRMNLDLQGLRGVGAKEGVTEAVYGQQSAEVTREAMTRILPLQAQLAVAQDNLQAAQERTDTLFKLYSQDAQNKIDHWNNLVKANYEFFTNEEKKKLDALNKVNDFNMSIAKEQITNIGDIAKSVVKDNPALYSSLTRTPVPTMTAGMSAADYAQKVSQWYAGRQADIAKYGGSSTDTGGDTPLYNGLKPATATAVRGQVSTFKSEPSVQNFVVVQEGRNFAKSLSNTTTNPVDDQGLIYSLAKALDPGSVVREGEYATAQKYSQSWINAYGKGVTQALAGTGFLTEQARKNIKATIESKYKSSERTYDNLFSQYVGGINNLTGRDDGAKFLKDYKIGSIENSLPKVTDKSKRDIFDSVVSYNSQSPAYTTIDGTYQNENNKYLSTEQQQNQLYGNNRINSPFFNLFK